MGRSGEITRIAAAQGGFISGAQMTDLGLSLSAIQRRVASGDLTLVVNGIYRVFPPNSHIDLIRGAMLALPDATVSHQSAAHLLELPSLPELIPTVTVASHTTHRFPGVLVRRNDDISPLHLSEVEGVIVTNPARTVFDLAGILDYRDFERLAESSILAGRLHLNHLDSLVDQLARRGKPGVRAVRDFVETRAGGPADATVLERRGRKVLEDGGLPTPQSQFPLPWSEWKRFDDAYPEARLAIEWDSRDWHTQQETMTSDRKRDRDAASHGWLILRFTWIDVTKHPDEVISTVSELLETRRSAA